jgi:hypothetical protein
LAAFSTVHAVHKFWEKNILGLILGDFSQTHLVTLLSTDATTKIGSQLERSSGDDFTKNYRRVNVPQKVHVILGSM